MKYSFKTLFSITFLTAVAASAYRRDSTWTLISVYVVSTAVTLFALSEASLRWRSRTTSHLSESSEKPSSSYELPFIGVLLAVSLLAFSKILSSLFGGISERLSHDFNSFLFETMEGEAIAVAGVVLAFMLCPTNGVGRTPTRFWNWVQGIVAVKAMVMITWIGGTGVVIWLVQIAIRGILLSRRSVGSPIPAVDLINWNEAAALLSLSLLGLAFVTGIPISLRQQCESNRVAQTSQPLAWVAIAIRLLIGVGISLGVSWRIYYYFPLLFDDPRVLLEIPSLVKASLAVVFFALGFVHYCLVTSNSSHVSGRKTRRTIEFVVGVLLAMPIVVATIETIVAQFGTGFGSASVMFAASSMTRPLMLLALAMFLVGLRYAIGALSSRERQMPAWRKVSKTQFIALFLVGLFYALELAFLCNATAYFLDVTISLI